MDDSTTMAAYAIYSRSGKYFFVANHRGMVTVVETASMDIVQALRVPEGATVIKRLELSRDGKHLMVVSMTKVIASYDVNDVDLAPEDRDAEVGLYKLNVVGPIA
jgi:hypothetical protein